MSDETIVETKPTETKIEEVKQPEKKRITDNIPTPQKILSMMLLAVIIGVVVKFWPTIITSVFGDFSQKNPTDVSPMIFVLFAIIGILLILIMGVWSVRGIWWPFMVASWTNNIVLMAFTKNKMISFIRPKEVNWNHIRIDADSTIDSDPNSRYTAPNKVPVLPFIPDHARTLDPRALVLDSKRDLSIDINTLDNIGTLNYIKGMKKMTNPLSSFLNSGMLWIVAAIACLMLVMWPYFTQQMDQSNKVSAMQNTVLQCNQQLVAHGITPIGLEATTTTTATTIPNNMAKPSGGVTTK